MNLVVDANILFSAIIRNSSTTKILFEKKLTLFSPDFILQEFLKHKNTILEKSSRNEEDFNRLLRILSSIINIIPKKEYYKLLKEAKKICPDVNDVPYFAAALKLRCGIWSNDKKLKEQSKIKIYSTEELIKIIKNDYF